MGLPSTNAILILTKEKSSATGYFTGKHSSGEAKELQTNVLSDHF